MKTFVATIKSRNGKRSEIEYPMTNEQAEDPALRGNFISAISASLPDGKTLVNWNIVEWTS